MTMLSLTGAIITEWGYVNPDSTKVDLQSVLTELQGLRESWIDGGAQSAGLTIANIQTTDTLRGVLYFPRTHTNVSLITDLLAKAYISAASTIKITSVTTADGKVKVLWFDKSGAP